MAVGNITDADAIIMLTVENLYGSGVQIQGFSADTAWTAGDAQIAEARMGVDGKLSAGYTPSPRTINISLEASSPSLEVMRNIVASSQLNNAVYTCSMQITIPSQKKEYSLTNGVLHTAHDLSDGKKVLDPSQFTFIFEKCKPSSI
jgi:hypothetical protein